jgi:2-oxoglutarate ferredoxin oxidoreductase subunit delta
MPRIQIVEDRCKGCRLCPSVCPKDCIEMGSHVNKLGVNPAVYVGGCVACGSCVIVCPDIAIELLKDAEDIPNAKVKAPKG